jgi:hypothetical protein
MPRHTDPRLRLRRVTRGYELLPIEVRSVGPFENECRCGGGPGECSWAKQRASRERGYQARKGSWVSQDERFVVEWVVASGVPTKERGNGHVRLWDRVLGVESWHRGIGEVRGEMLKRYERESR